MLEFSPSRRSNILHEFFPPSWKGDLQSDAARMYPSAFKHRPQVVRFGCLAHARRKIVEALKAGERDMGSIYRDIRTLYALETWADAYQLTHAQRAGLRHLKAKPILKRIHRKMWDLRKGDRAARFGKLKEAVDYVCNNWRELTRYAKIGNGHVLIDNNSIERCFRPTKVGLRNYLFIGSPKAAWVSTVLYSVIGTCRLEGVNPEEYIAWVLPRLAAGTNKSTATGLLPSDFARLNPT